MNAPLLPPDDWAISAAVQPASNVEIKARLPDLDPPRQVALGLATARLPDQRQIDTYFSCRSGRLKLREINGESAQLIWYQRPNQKAAKSSHYHMAPIPPASPLKTALQKALGVIATVDKQREIYLFHNVRIHLDEVRQLGYFLEFEAVLDAQHDSHECHRLVQQLRERFGINESMLCHDSYSDMMMAGRE